MDSNSLSGVKKGPKKIEISSSSLVALKAELLNKQSQVQRVRTEGTTVIRKHPSKKKTVPSNAGVEERAKRDEEQKKEEEPTLERARLILEEKAKLYERLSRDKNLLDEDTISEEQSQFLVNFQQKVVENTLQQRRTASTNTSKPARESSSDDDSGAEDRDYPATNPEEEWVDFVDTFGRTRRCLKKDLPVFQKQDLELNKPPVSSSTPTTYGNFVVSSEPASNGGIENVASLDEEARKRQRQLWEEEEEKNKQKSKVHYQDILYQEARQHGVGFYSFSKDEEERAKQMEELDKIRRQTEAARVQTAQASTDKQSALEARLKKVRDRKRQKLGLPPLKEQPTPEAVHEALPEATPAIDSVKQAEENLRKTVARSLPQSAKVRPWDLGKEGVPKKQPVMTQHSWVDQKREERKQEFAPPSAYLENDTSRPRKFARHQEPVVKPKPVISEDSIISGLAFMKQMQFPSPAGLPPTPLKKSEYEIEDNDNDDDLMPPGETEMPQPEESTSRWRTIPTRGAEIAPPPCMEYYNNSSSSKTRQRGGSDQPRTNVFQSFSVGINQASQRKDAVGDKSSTDAKKEETLRCKWDFSQ